MSAMQGMTWVSVRRAAKFLLDQEQAVLGPLHQQQRLGTELEHLAADFRADAAAGAGDHASCGPPTSVLIASLLSSHRLAAQEVVDVDVANLRRIVARQQVVVGRNDLERDLALRRTAPSSVRNSEPVSTPEITSTSSTPSRVAMFSACGRSPPHGNAAQRRADAGQWS